MEAQNQGHACETALVVDLVELEQHAKEHGTPAPHAKHYAFRVDKTRVVVDTPTITGAQILAKVDKSPQKFKLYQHIRGHQPILIAPDQVVDLREPGLERFTTMPKDTTEGLEVPLGRRDFQLPANDEDYLYGLGLRWETRRENQVQWLILRGWKIPSGYNVGNWATRLWRSLV